MQLLAKQAAAAAANNNNNDYSQADSVVVSESANGQTATIPATTTINQIKRRIIAKLFSGVSSKANDTSSSGLNGNQKEQQQDSYNSIMDLGDRVYAAEKITKKRKNRVRINYNTTIQKDPL